MSWRVAKSLETLRRQINEMAPDRDKSSDGTIGDPAHQARDSDHNPNQDGVVTALDITNDPAHGVNARGIAEMLLLSKDPRIKYVISNRQIFSSPAFTTTKTPWQWRAYNGANAHTQHVHVSVLGNKDLYDDTRPWSVDRLARVQEPLRTRGSNRCVGITATVFGGAGDPNTSAYDGHFITDGELGVALPARLKSRPKVRVFNSESGATVECDIVDVGPWNTDDPYWEKGERPQAESGTDHHGRRTNLAGIDLTPAAARAIGIPGKGKVDWEFVGASPVEHGGATMPEPANNLGSLLLQLASLIQGMQKAQAGGGQAPATQGQIQPADLQKIFDAITVLIGKDKKLGPVNGALGQTIGDLFNGKKTAIGVLGALATSLLSQIASTGATTAGGAAAAGAGTSIGNLLLTLAPATGLSGYALPVFLAITAWGVLGKMEKWSQGGTPPPK